jgi:hypothetical protein
MEAKLKEGFCQERRTPISKIIVATIAASRRGTRIRFI